jgi:heme/copper-type cytochrome/quinol oxidase subunit 2
VTIGALLAGSGNTALVVVLVLAIVVPLMVLAVVCWIFWRAARRADATGSPLHDDRPPRP